MKAVQWAAEKMKATAPAPSGMGAILAGNAVPGAAPGAAQGAAQGASHGGRDGT